MKLSLLLEQVVGEFGWKFEGFDKEYHETGYWSEFEKEFYGELPKLPLVPIMPAWSQSTNHSHYKMDERSEIHCAFHCPFNLKPILAAEEHGDNFKVYVVIDNKPVPLNDVITGKGNYAVYEHVRNVFTCIDDRGANGYREHVRQRATYIKNKDYIAYKCVLYTVNSKVAKILLQYGIKH